MDRCRRRLVILLALCISGCMYDEMWPKHESFSPRPDQWPIQVTLGPRAPTGIAEVLESPHYGEVPEPAIVLATGSIRTEGSIGWSTALERALREAREIGGDGIWVGPGAGSYWTRLRFSFLVYRNLDVCDPGEEVRTGSFEVRAPPADGWLFTADPPGDRVEFHRLRDPDTTIHVSVVRPTPEGEAWTISGAAEDHLVRLERRLREAGSRRFPLPEYRVVRSARETRMIAEARWEVRTHWIEIKDARDGFRSACKRAVYLTVPAVSPPPSFFFVVDVAEYQVNGRPPASLPQDQVDAVLASLVIAD